MNYQKLIFIDNDSVIAFQDGEKRIQFVNVQAQIEAFSLSNTKTGAKDITIKFEKPIHENYEVNPDFDVAKALDDQFEKNSDDSIDPMA